MKKTIKTFVNLLAVMLSVICCFAFTGCKEKITTIEVNVAVYDYEENVSQDYTLTLNLYDNLAPQTVANIKEYVAEGYYNNTTFYKDSNYTTQFMLGDLKVVDGEIQENAVKPVVDGEFEYGSVKGSNLVNAKGYVGLWRSWYAVDDSTLKYQANNGIDTGRATWFMPTEAISTYNGNFCVFAKYDVDDEDNAEALEAITAAFESANVTKYVVFYTGEYDSADTEKYGLSFNCMLETEFNELTDAEKEELNIFTAQRDQYVAYNQKTIAVPTFNDNKTGAYIKNIIVK